MFARRCANSAESFCYICGEFTIKKYQRDITENIKKPYKLYFGCRFGDKDKKRAPHIMCMKCTSCLCNGLSEQILDLVSECQ